MEFGAFGRGDETHRHGNQSSGNSLINSGRGLPQSRTLRAFASHWPTLRVLDCGSPLPLFHQRFDRHFQSHPRKFPFWIPPSTFCILPPMFDTIAAQITTATDKLAHLRRFL
jgi:hypothetical protein